MGRDISEPQREWLTGELDAWRAVGIVSDDQIAALLGLYVTPGEVSERRQSKALITLVALAATLVGLGVLLLVGYNWEAMPAALKVVAVFGAVVAAHLIAMLVRDRPGLRGASEAAFLFGCLLYGAGIWLIAQIFHINAGSADGFWWWALGVLPFALVLETLVMHTLLVALLAVWIGFEVFNGDDLVAWIFGRVPGMARGGYSLLPMAAMGLAWAYRKRSVGAVALYVALVAWWVILQPFAWRFEVNPVHFVGAVGGLLVLAAEAHRAGDPLAVPYRFYGTALIAGALVPLGFFDFNHYLGRQGVESHPAGLQAIYLTSAIVVLSGATLAVVAIVRRRSRREPVSLAEELLEIARRQWLPCGMIALMAVLGFWSALTADALVPTLAANAAMIVLALWLMQLGLREDRGRPFAAGVAYFLFWAVLRYIDLFGAFGGMLGAAVVFFLCGVALAFAAVLFNRHRKPTPATGNFGQEQDD